MYYLYLKTHEITGLKYLGQTTKDPFKYKGSGLYWSNHIKVHGNFVSTTILKECSSKEELRHWGEYFSNLWDIIKSDKWANLKIEIGDGGSPKGINLGRKHSKETKDKISKSKKGKSNPKSVPITQETKNKISDTLRGRPRSPESIEKQQKTRDKHGPYTHTEDTKQKLRKPITEETRRKRLANPSRPTKDHIWINDGTNEKLHLGECLDGWSIGRLYIPTPPSQKGKFWITNGTENKMVNEMPDGWTRGRSKRK